MKKYKLIKEYPGSPRLGTEIIEPLYVVPGGPMIGAIPLNNGEYKEFWEEVVENDYEILSYILIENNSIITKRKNGLFLNKKYPDQEGIYPEDIYSKSNHHKIHSIKRLSDGEIFTVDDIVQIGIDKNRKINIVSISSNDNRFFINGMCIKSYNINKAKQLLFKTEDGVDIYKEDNYYYIQTEEGPRFLYPWKVMKINHHRDEIKPSIKSIKRFSTKEKAEEWIIMNKPCLSLNNIFTMCDLDDIDMRRLKSIVKNKLK
ncbi:MAG TPA: hypothetical protein VF680_17165 [Allosphingosinicella sp.]|jgi:hypothetical protein